MYKYIKIILLLIIAIIAVLYWQTLLRISRMAYHLELYHPILPAGVGSTCSHRCADRCSVLIVSLKKL